MCCLSQTDYESLCNGTQPPSSVLEEEEEIRSMFLWGEKLWIEMYAEEGRNNVIFDAIQFFLSCHRDQSKKVALHLPYYAWISGQMDWWVDRHTERIISLTSPATSILSYEPEMEHCKSSSSGAQHRSQIIAIRSHHHNLQILVDSIILNYVTEIF